MRGIHFHQVCKRLILFFHTVYRSGPDINTTEINLGPGHAQVQTGKSETAEVEVPQIQTRALDQSEQGLVQLRSTPKRWDALGCKHAVDEADLRKCTKVSKPWSEQLKRAEAEFRTERWWCLQWKAWQVNEHGDLQVMGQGGMPNWSIV